MCVSGQGEKTKKKERGGRNTHISGHVLLLGEDGLVHGEVGGELGGQGSDLGLVGITESLPAAGRRKQSQTSQYGVGEKRVTRTEGSHEIGRRERVGGTGRTT